MASGDYKHSYFNEAYDQDMEDHNVLKPRHIRLSLLSSQMKIKAPNNEFLYFSKIANKKVRTMNY